MASSAQKDEWIIRGLITASECFRCANKLEHRVEVERVHIHCRDNCNYLPLEKERQDETG